MDPENKIFLTCKISVLTIEKGSDINIKDLTLISNQKPKKLNQDDDDSSSSEDERDGAKIREDFNFFKNVLKENGLNEGPTMEADKFNDDNKK